MIRTCNDEFGFEVVAEGTFRDDGFDIRTVVIRVSGSAGNEWIMSSVLNNRHVYKTEEEWEAYKEKKEKMRKNWEHKILKLFNISKSENNGFNISKNVSEIFTVVFFTKCEEDQSKILPAEGATGKKKN